MFWIVLVFGLPALIVIEGPSVVRSLPVTINGTEIKGFAIKEQSKMRDWLYEDGDEMNKDNDNIATVDNVKRRRSKYVGAKLVAMNEEKRTDRRAVKSVSNGSTKKSRSWRSRLFRKKPLTDNKDRTVETTTGNSVSGKARSRKMSSKMSSKKIKNAKKMSTAALVTELLSSPTSSFEFATKTTVGRGEKQRPAARLVRMVPVTVTQAQEQTTADKSLTLPCRSFTQNTVQRPKIGPTTDRRQPRTWSCSQTPQINVVTESSGSTGRTINVAAATLPTCVNRLAVDGAAADEDPMTKGFMKITSTERWTTTEIA